MTNYSRSVLKSNGLHRSKNLPVKFGFSSKSVPANIGKKLPPQCCSKLLLIPFFNFSHKGPTFAFAGESGIHSALLKEPYTMAHTAKQGPSLPRPQCGFVPPAKYLIFRHAFIYIHFPVLCEPPLYQQREKSGEAAAISFIPTVPHCVFQLLAQTAHVRFHSRKWVHPRLHSKDRTQRLTRRNRGLHFCAIVQGI